MTVEAFFRIRISLPEGIRSRSQSVYETEANLVIAHDLDDFPLVETKDEFQDGLTTIALFMFQGFVWAH